MKLKYNYNISPFFFFPPALLMYLSRCVCSFCFTEKEFNQVHCLCGCHQILHLFCYLCQAAGKSLLLRSRVCFCGACFYVRPFCCSLANGCQQTGVTLRLKKLAHVCMLLLSSCSSDNPNWPRGEITKQTSSSCDAQPGPVAAEADT